MDIIEITSTTGAVLGGGFVTGRIFVDRKPFLIVTAPKAEAALKGRWNKNLKPVTGARSFFDGLANTRAMAEAGSEIAKKVLALTIGGHTAFKPTTDENWVYRNGDNPSSDPPGYPYTATFPAQTAIEAFRRDGAEAFEAAWHATSTQYGGDADCAWIQDFDDGYQDSGPKGSECYVRPVRRVAI